MQPQVFDVLHYLVANHDRIASKDELIEKIWNKRFASEATLSSRIKAVRQLLGDTGKQQSLLQTQRHRGFRYTGPVECALQGTRAIASAVATIEPMLAQLEWQKAERKRPEDFRAWDYCHKALWHLYRFTVEDLQAARGWFRMALELEPGLARAHAGLACVSVQLAFYGTPAARAEELRQALALFRLDRLEEAEDYVRAAVRQPHAAY